MERAEPGPLASTLHRIGEDALNNEGRTVHVCHRTLSGEALAPRVPGTNNDCTVSEGTCTQDGLACLLFERRICMLDPNGVIPRDKADCRN